MRHIHNLAELVLISCCRGDEQRHQYYRHPLQVRPLPAEPTIIVWWHGSSTTHFYNPSAKTLPGTPGEQTSWYRPSPTFLP